MPIYLHNTLTRRKEAFQPLKPDHVGIYVCGPTVYDFAHIGNARPVVVFDVLYRLLKLQFKSVTYVRNITDIEDKIIAAATKNGEPISALTARTDQPLHALDMLGRARLVIRRQRVQRRHVLAIGPLGARRQR